MKKWLVLSVCASAWMSLGCSSSVQGGLANAPGLGGQAHPDDRIADVIANGRDSCSRQGNDGPLRYRVPPCETEVRPAASDLVPPWLVNGGQSMVLPWLEHFYTGWPCRHPAGQGQDARPVAWAAPTGDVASCDR
jgi:hypothetical protein